MPSKDSDYIAHRFVDIVQEEEGKGKIRWFKRTDLCKDSITECLLCREAEEEMYTKYAHPKAHLEAHTKANTSAEERALQEHSNDYLDYYVFFYGKEYTKRYATLYTHYRDEYRQMLYARQYADDQLCSYHIDSVRYHKEYSVNSASRKGAQNTQNV